LQLPSQSHRSPSLNSSQNPEEMVPAGAPNAVNMGQAPKPPRPEPHPIDPVGLHGAKLHCFRTLTQPDAREMTIVSHLASLFMASTSVPQRKTSFSRHSDTSMLDESLTHSDAQLKGISQSSRVWLFHKTISAISKSQFGDTWPHWTKLGSSQSPTWIRDNRCPTPHNRLFLLARMFSKD